MHFCWNFRHSPVPYINPYDSFNAKFEMTILENLLVISKKFFSKNVLLISFQSMYISLLNATGLQNGNSIFIVDFNHHHEIWKIWKFWVFTFYFHTMFTFLHLLQLWMIPKLMLRQLFETMLEIAVVLWVFLEHSSFHQCCDCCNHKWCTLRLCIWLYNPLQYYLDIEPSRQRWIIVA